MKTNYYFELLTNCSPIVKGGELIKDSNVGGIKNTYNVYKVYSIFTIILYKRHLGKAVLLRPYKSIWNKRMSRLPKIYWGKDPIFINMWLLLTKDYDRLSSLFGSTSVLMYESTTQTKTISILNVQFESKLIKKFLKTNQSFSINQK